MKQNLPDTVALLERTPAALDALLRGLPDAWIRSNEGEGTWSALDVVGHLIHGERTDWIPRARRILEFGESRPFDAFEREGYRREGKALGTMLDEFALSRKESLAELSRLNPGAEDLERRGSHPALGVVTLSQLLATWAAHDLTHLHQISRILAHPYREAVGPWSAYLGVLRCDGHGAS
jgi:hypothetical protein